MTGKPSLNQYGLSDANNDGVIDNYIQKFNEARIAAQQADKAAENYWKSLGGRLDANGNVIQEASMSEDQQKRYNDLVEKAKQL